MRETPSQTSAWEYYQQGRQYNQRLSPSQYSLVNTNIEFYAGNQWLHLPGTAAMASLPKPVFNVIKRVTNVQVANLMASGFSVRLEPLSYYDGSSAEDPDSEACAFAQAELDNLINKLRLQHRAREALFDGAITGDYCAHFYFDPTAIPYGGRLGPDVRGEIKMELVDGINVMFGNPNSRDVESQPYILVIGRDTCDSLNEEMDYYRSGKDDGIRVSPDSDTENQVGNGGKTELSTILGHGKATYVYLYRKFTKKVPMVDVNGDPVMELVLGKDKEPVQEVDKKGKPVVDSYGLPVYKMHRRYEMKTTVHVSKYTRYCTIYEDIRLGNPLSREADGIKQFSKEEQERFYYYLGSDASGKKAEQYFEFLQSRKRMEMLQEMSEWAGQNTGTRMLSFAASRLLLPFVLANSYVSYSGSPLNFTDLRRAADGGIAAGLTDKGLFNTGFLSGSENIGGIDISLGTAVQLASSMADSTMVAFIGGGGGTILLGADSGYSAYQEAIDNGIDSERAIAIGVANGIFEALFEEVSIEHLLSQTPNELSTAFLNAAMRQGMVEASEEWFTEVADQIADGVILGEDSGFNSSWKELVRQGVDVDTAKYQALNDMAVDRIAAALGGFASGGLMTGGHAIINAIAYKADEAKAKNKYKEANEGYLYFDWADRLDGSVLEETMADYDRIFHNGNVAELMRQEGMSRADARKASKEYTEIRKEHDRISASQSKGRTARVATIQEQTESRAAAIEANSAASGEKISVVRSDSVQRYIDSGRMNLAVAQKAGAVLDQVVSGSLTAENISSSQIDSLNLYYPYAAKIASDVLGVDIRQTSSKADARSSFKNALRNYAQSKVATVQNEATAEMRTVSATDNTGNGNAAEAKNAAQRRYATTSSVPRVIPRASDIALDNAASSESTAQTAKRMTIPPAQAQVRSVSEAETARQAPIQAGTEIEDVSTPRASDALPAGAMTYREWLNSNGKQAQKMSTEERVSAYNQYVDDARARQSASMMSRTEFGKQYTSKHPGASEVDADLAYQEYRQNSGAEARSNQAVGLVRNEYSESLNTETVDSVDSLLRLFGLKGQFADLGNANGYYDSSTGEVILDIAPVRSDASNAFLFAVSHELGHAIRDRIGMVGWKSFQQYAIGVMGGEKAVKAKQASNEAYASDAAAREDVACDFIGRLLSDKGTLDTFTEAIRKGEVKKESASKIVNAFRSIIGKLRGKGTKANDTASAALVERVQQEFGADIDQAEKVVKALQKAVEAARATQLPVIPRASELRSSMKDKKNATGEGDAASEKYKDTKRSATSPLSGSPATQGSFSMASKPVTAAVDHLGIGVSLSQLNESVKVAISIFSEIVYSIEEGKAALGSKKKISASNLEGLLVKTGILHRGGLGDSAYRIDGDHALRISNHSARADNFSTSGENLSIVFLTTNKTNDFIESDKSNVIEVQFKKSYLDRNPDVFKDLVKDIARFVVTGEYHDTAGAKRYNISGSEEFKRSMEKRLGEDAKNREKKYSMKESTVRNSEFKDEAEQQKPVVDVMRKREGADLLRIMRPSVKEDINQAVNTYGAIPEGENPVRDIKVPRRVIPNAKVRQTVRTALESSVTPESLVPTIEQSVIEGNFNYTEDTNKSQMERANKWIEGRTIEDARDDWFRSIGKKATPDVIARGMLLYNQYATASNDTNLSDSERRANRETATRILNDISVSTTESAQMVQMIRILKKQTPDMQLYALKRNIQKIQDQLDAKYGGKKNGAPQIVLNEGMAEQWLSALRRGDQDLAHDTEAALLQDIANQVPARFMDKWNAWRYLCMLGNPKTIIRNTGGNIAMMPMKSAKDKIGATLELAFVKKENRTKYLGSLLSTKKGRAMLDFAGTDFKEFDVQDMLTGVGKYHDSDIGTRLNAAIRDAQGTFSAPVLKQWQAATNYLMNEAPGISDMAFMQHHYKNSFAQAALARGYTAEDFTSGRISEQQLDSLRGYAVNQALKATYSMILNRLQTSTARSPPE